MIPSYFLEDSSVLRVNSASFFSIACTSSPDFSKSLTLPFNRTMVLSRSFKSISREPIFSRCLLVSASNPDFNFPCLSISALSVTICASRSAICLRKSSSRLPSKSYSRFRDSSVALYSLIRVCPARSSSEILSLYLSASA